MPIETLVNKYLLTEEDVDGSSFHPLVRSFANSTITPLIDGNIYFGELYDAIVNLDPPESEQSIYLAAWNFTSNFEFSASDGIHPARLIDLLAYKASQGADVRVLIWVNDFVLSTGTPLPNIPGELVRPRAPHVQRMIENLNTIQALRSFTNSDGSRPLADRVIANTLDHPYGAVHTKFALVFDRNKSKGFTGGIDPVLDRFSGNFHGTGPNVDGAYWHDVMAMVDGEACQPMYDFFRSMWNALSSRVTAPSRSPRFRVGADVILGTPVATTLISDRTLANPPADDVMRVQSLRTFPDLHRPLIAALEPPLDFAPDGIFETEQALRKAIAAAEQYIYVEDQTMQGSAAFGWINAALKAKPNLKVILLTGLVDPADPPPELRNTIIRDHLLAGLSSPELGRLIFFEHQRAVIHSKLWLIDDVFALIGSANIFNRGMYVEIEHGVSFVQEGPVNAVDELRRNLWGEHFRMPPNRREELQSLELSLSIWNPAWSSAPPPATTFMLPSYTDDVRRFDRPWGIGSPATFGPFDRIPSLTRLHVPLTDETGQIETITTNGHTYKKWRTWNREVFYKPDDPNAPPHPPVVPGPVIALGADFIDDSMLPWNDSATAKPGLVGEWVAVLHAALNTTFVSRINGHIDRRIFFTPPLPATPAIGDLVYVLLTPVLRRVQLPPEVTFDPILPLRLLYLDWLGDPTRW